VHDRCRSLAANQGEIVCIQELSARGIGWNFLRLGRTENLFRCDAHADFIFAPALPYFFVSCGSLPVALGVSARGGQSREQNARVLAASGWSAVQ